MNNIPKGVEDAWVLEHKDWYTYDGYFSPTENAPPDAVQAFERINKYLDKNIDLFPPFNIAKEVEKAQIV